MKSLKIASMAAIVMIAAGCASQPKEDAHASEIAALRADIAEENSEKINRTFRGKQYK